MKNMITFLAAILILTACSNSGTTTTTTEETKDTSVTLDSTDNTDNNVVTPPASNGQF